MNFYVRDLIWENGEIMAYLYFHLGIFFIMENEIPLYLPRDTE